jgi:hypothetical protein
MATSPNDDSGEPLFTATLTGKFKFRGRTGGSAKRIIAAIRTAVNAFGVADITFTTDYEIPGLAVVNLGPLRNASSRRNALGGAGIYTIDELCKRTAEGLAGIVGTAGVRLIRRHLYFMEPRRHLKGDDPNGFPRLVDSLDITGEDFRALLGLSITTIEQLREHTEDLRLSRLFDVTDLLARHHQEFAGR